MARNLKLRRETREQTFNTLVREEAERLTQTDKLLSYGLETRRRQYESDNLQITVEMDKYVHDLTYGLSIHCRIRAYHPATNALVEAQPVKNTLAHMGSLRSGMVTIAQSARMSEELVRADDQVRFASARIVDKLVTGATFFISSMDLLSGLLNAFEHQAAEAQAMGNMVLYRVFTALALETVNYADRQLGSIESRLIV